MTAGPQRPLEYTKSASQPIKLLITAGSKNFVVNDSFRLPVAPPTLQKAGLG